MRVKISYSVKLDDVPGHVANLLSDAKQCLMGSSSSLVEILDDLEEERDVLKIVENLNSLRQDLFNVDAVLSDVGDILIGYENTLLSQQVPQIQTQEDLQIEEESDE